MLSKLLPFLSLCIPGLVFGDPSDLIVDQEFTFGVTGTPAFPGSGGQSSQNIEAIKGQEFTPSLQTMNFFELYIGELSGSAGLGIVLNMTIHRNSLAGPELARSENLALPYGFDGPARFIFSEPVPLVPGEIAGAEIQVVSNDGSWFLAANATGYPGGRLVDQAGLETGDAWFREGLIIPEPSAKWLLIFGACVLGFRLSLLPRCQ